MGSSGQLCGSLSGALAVIGFTLGKTKSGERDHRLMWKISHKMVKKFMEITKEYGGPNCSDIAGVNWKDREAVALFYKDPGSSRGNCVKVIEKTTDYLQTLIVKYFSQED